MIAFDILGGRGWFDEVSFGFARPEGLSSDGDALPDEWEWRSLGTLSRDGTGDLDGDGLSDAEEFEAGTDPALTFGLGYLSLGYRVSTLSGGDAQRLLLAAELASPACVGTLYLLDEPASGQHTRDVNLLLRALESFRDAGGTVVVVEHRRQVVSAADWIVELGPSAGPEGGRVVAQGPAAIP